jgi:acyl-CoA synthetase (AMP-forming)/AMP-acid ligase II
VSPGDVLSWLDTPAPARGLRVSTPRGGWHFTSYRDLAALARRAAGGLRALDVPDGAVVGVVAGGGPAFVAAFFGALAAGCTAAPLPAPSRFSDRISYDRQLGAALRVARPAAVIATPDAIDRVRPLAPPGCRVADLDALTSGQSSTPHGPPGAHSLLQFTSGSTGPARAVRISAVALAANVDAIGRWLGMTAADATATWLPPHHDMGLIGCLVTPVAHQVDLWQMRPEEFVHRPARYLECFGRHGATLTAMPAFGLDYVVRRVGADRLAGLDFSGWRALVVGAERVDPATLVAFAGHLAPYGFDARALAPAYGLAEATLAVTGAPPGRPWRTADAGGGARVVGCGPALGGASVSIVDESGRPRRAGAVGEIVVRGPAVADGYAGDVSGSATRLTADALRTGDAGFLLDGHLYVLGRLGDALKLRGRTLFAEELEATLRAAGVPPRRVAVLLGHVDGRAHVVALFERAEPDWPARAGPLLGRLTEGARVVLLDAPAGTIARTASGKPRRRLLWHDFLAGRLPGTATPAMTASTGGIR